MESTFQWNSKTKVEFLKKLPSRERLAESLGFRPEKILVIYDQRLQRQDTVAKWLGEIQFKYSVRGGEELKDLAYFPNHIKNIFKLLGPFSPRSLCILGLGGGSVGDFTGFLSSVLKRGVPLVHVPSTLLAALDSAHGGKTALNIAKIKNQLGTFYPAESVLIVRSLFEGLPAVQLQSAGGELAKMALLTAGPLWEHFQSTQTADLDSVWEILPAAIEAKYAVVESDPMERSGERQILNLGHSLGHALESYYGLAHGVAVGHGLVFALEWSHHQGFWRGDLSQVLNLLRERGGFVSGREFAKKYRSMSRSKLEKMISEDKKLTDSRHMSFVFLEDLGRPLRKVVTFASFLAETQRQGWTKV